jgi:GT2 family glycosyltransferase
MKASIVIPNWNGRELLEQHLPRVLAAAGGSEVIVVDDASTDDSVALVERSFPSVRLVRRERNGGFSAACTSGVEAAGGDVIVLLNSDVEPRGDFLPPLLEHFVANDVFAVSCLGLREDGITPGQGMKAPCFRRGLLKFDSVFDTCGPAPSFYAVGGHCALSKRKFLELGGFDELFGPFYWEDVDLCYRAWKRGWRTLFEPRSVVVHMHHTGTIKSFFGRQRAKGISHRNRLLFIWKNISSTRILMRQHLPALAARTAFGFLWLDWRFYAPLFRALPLLPAALRARAIERRLSKLTDEQVFANWGRPGK